MDDCFSDECVKYYKSTTDQRLQKQLESPMPWIGMYIAAASAACSLAMAADAFNGFRRKNFWLPCKYFSLNAFSLTLVTVAMKLTVDLTGKTVKYNDELARVSSLVFMSTAMGSFMTSLGSMESNEIILNVAALGILVITIVVNVIIHEVEMCIFSEYQLFFLGEEIVLLIFMLLLLVMLCSLSITVPTATKYIELVYQEMHNRVSNKQADWGTTAIDELRALVTKYWVMAQTGSPQFVISRSAICISSNAVCLLAAVTLLVAHIRLSFNVGVDFETSSSYKWSLFCILYVQSMGVALGTIFPIFRWFIAAKFKSSMIGCKSLKDALKVEHYWTEMLEDWRESPLPIHIQYQKVRKILHDAKRLLINFCICLQVVIVLASKLLLLISATCGKVILLCFHHIKNLKACDSAESWAETEQDFSCYVVLLEGEAELPKKTLRSICNEVDELFGVGRKRQPKDVIELVSKSENFNGVREFDSKHIQRLRSQEPPNCWSLPIVTLTSIAIALSNITAYKSEQLLRSVGEGLYFVKLIEKALDRNGELANIRNAADVVWVGVDLYQKWLDIDIRGISLKSQSYKNTLQELSDTAQKIVTDFKTSVENPLSWPLKVIAANSMYRISQTILLAHKNNDSQTEDELFERLSIMISDIISACLTNLARVVTLKCHSSAIKEREEGVHQAALLLGKGENILEILQHRKLPSMRPEKAACIEEWRVFMEQSDANPVASVAGASTTIPNSDGELVIELEG